MADRFIDDLELALSSYSMHSTDEYMDEEDETEEEYEGEEVNGLVKDRRAEDLACPFCFEDFDVLGLCCHIDADHRMEVKPGICPVCAVKVGGNMASHVITHHESILKTLCTKKHHSARSRSAIFLLRKELQDKHLLVIKEALSVGISRGKAVDTMLLSFVNTPPKRVAQEPIKHASMSEASLSVTRHRDDSSGRIEPSFSDMNHQKSGRSEFLQGMLMSTILDDF